MELEPYFKTAIENNASDLHLVEGSVPALRISGELTRLRSVQKPPQGKP